MQKRLFRLLAIGLLVILFMVGISGLVWFRRALAPTPPGPPILVRFPRPRPLEAVATYLERKGIVRNALALRIYSLVHKGRGSVATGTYSLDPGQSPDDVLRELQEPLSQLIRMPETNWARRDARWLQLHNVTDAADYLTLVNSPSQFQSVVKFPLPSTTLEGYLYPDTYDFPPLLGAHDVIVRRLKTFESKVWKRLGPVPDLDHVITVASLVELEAGTDADRPMIAGVIENRLKKGIPLQIDAGIMYALGKWRRLFFKDYKNVKSPYNLYLHKGLPPTPICSPSLKSIEAALSPAHHEYLYYVALPNGSSLFAKTPEQHEHNIHLRIAALKKRKTAGGSLGEILGIPLLDGPILKTGGGG